MVPKDTCTKNPQNLYRLFYLRKGFCWCDKVKDLKVSFSGLSNWALNLMTSVLVRERQGETWDIRGKKAMWRWRQRLEWCWYKPRNAWSRQSWKRQRWILPWSLWRECGSLQSWVDFWPPWLWETKFPLFLSHMFMVICYSSLRKVIEVFNTLVPDYLIWSAIRPFIPISQYSNET